MDFASLKAFVTVVESGSFSGAAEDLFLTQPAISKRIAALETDLGCELFDRIGRKVTLTEAGLALIPRARAILAEVKESRRLITNLSGKIEGTLRIATSHHIGLHRLPSVLRHFSQRFPRVKLNIQFMGSESAYHAVEQAEVELAVATLPKQPASNLIITPVWRDPLDIVVASNHPLALKAPKVDLQTLSQHEVILPPCRTNTAALVQSVFSEHRLELNIAMEISYLETIKMMTAIGLGWSALPHSLIDGSLKVLKVPHLKLTRSLGIIQHARHTLGNAASAFIAAILDSRRK